MSKLKPIFIVAIAITGIALISGDCFAQGCSSCASHGASYGSVVVGGDCGCHGCCGGESKSGFSAKRAEFKGKLDHLSAEIDKVRGRNQAWPKPFDCADRQLYFSLWEPMIDQGWEEQCVLNSNHFDPETGELNQFGVHTVAGIMQNMPTTRKEVFIHREADESANNTRLLAVKNTIDTYYSQTGPARVSFSTKLPVTLSGTKAEAISRLAYENQPTPIIPVSAGETIASAIGN